MADDDPYVYPGTDVLRNNFGIRDGTELAQRESGLTAIRIAELERRFISGAYDIVHLQAVHRKIFGDLYPWAGELRTVQIAKGESMFALPAPSRRDPAAYLLRAGHGLRDVSRENQEVIERRERIFSLALIALGIETLMWTLALALT